MPEDESINRRQFLKFLGGASAGATLTGLGINRAQAQEQTPEERLTSLKETEAYNPHDLDYSRINEAPAEPTPEQVAYLEQHALEPKAMILEHLRGNTRLVALGEMHTEADMERFAVDLITLAAQENLIQFVALEIDTQQQAAIDAYVFRGETSPEFNSILAQHTDIYRKIFEVAVQHKLRVLCVDNHNAPDRDTHMRTLILHELQQRPNEKAIAYLGNEHVDRERIRLVDELGDQYYSVVTLNQRAGALKNTVYSAYARSSLKNQPVGLDTISQTPFSQVTAGPRHELFTEYGRITDAIVCLPTLRGATGINMSIVSGMMGTRPNRNRGG